MHTNLSRVLESYNVRYQYYRPTRLFDIHDWFLEDFNLSIRYHNNTFTVYDEDRVADVFADVPNQADVWVQSLCNRKLTVL